MMDFGRDFVVAAILGEKPTGGYRFQVSEVLRNGNTYAVSTLETRPGDDCMTTQALTNPYHVVRIPRNGTGAPDVRFSTLPALVRTCE